MDGIEKLDKNRNPAEMDAEALWYDDAILHYRYAKVVREGQRYVGWTREDFVNYHALLLNELKARNLPHFDRGDELDRETEPFLKRYAEVHPSGVKLGERIELKEVLPHFQPFKLRQPYVYLVGGLVIHGATEGDIDILVKDSPALPPAFRHVLEWRILRSLPERFWGRVQFHYDNFHGPFTDNIPLYDLTFERVNPENKVFRMGLNGHLAHLFEKGEVASYQEWARGRFEKQLLRAGSPEIERQAEASRRENAVKLFRFFVPMKPVKGTFPEQRQTLEAFLSLFEDADFPVYSTKKYDGMNVEVHKGGEKVVVFSEDGEDNTARFPGIVEAVKKLKARDLVVLAEIELWRDGKHLPREAVAGYAHGTGEPDDAGFVANVYDVVYVDGGGRADDLDLNAGDIHAWPFERRVKALEALGLPQATFEVPDPALKLNRAPFLLSKTRDELAEHTRFLAERPGSEGNVAKKHAGPYSLTGRDEAQIKFHVSEVLAGVVLERIETKVKGIYNYLYGVLPGDEPVKDSETAELDGRTYLIVGKTFSTNQRAEPGEVVEVEYETLNLTRDEEEGTVSLSAWAPRFMRRLPERKEPDTLEEAVAKARAARLLVEKVVTAAGETIFKDLAASSDADPDVEKANYVGNKRRLAKYIVDKFPEDGRTLFDPMCGVSAVLIEAARRGYRVKGNDLSIVPYWYSKGVFEGKPLSEEDVDELVEAPPHEGWLSREWKGVYPRPWQLRRYLDGLAKLAREWSGPKGWAAKAVASRVLQTLYSDSISGYSTRRYESLAKVRDVVRRAAKEVNGHAAEVSGKGEITNENAKHMRFPRADVVYFDPPFFKRDKGYVHYFETYKIMNSILLGRAWEEENLGPEDIPPILERLCKACKHIFISTSSNEAVPYARELARHKRSMKRYRVAYTQTSGFGSRDDHQREHLYVAKALAKQADPYMLIPDEDQTHRYVVQHHWRGRSVHADFRIESVDNEFLIGWTLNVLVAGKVKEPVLSLDDARKLAIAEYSKIDWDTGEFAKRRKRGAEALVDVEIVAERKAIEPKAWLTVEGETAEPEPGQPPPVGATRNFPGVFQIVDKGVCEYGAQKPWFHEYFPRSDRDEGGFRYRLLFRQLRVEAIQGKSLDLHEALLAAAEEMGLDPEVPDWDLEAARAAIEKGLIKAEDVKPLPAAESEFRDEAAWLLIKPLDQTPYAISKRAVADGWVPPKGVSALPKRIREKVPPAYRYWRMGNERERREMRDALVAALEKGELTLPEVEKAAPLPAPQSEAAWQAGAGPEEFEKRKLVPFNQWGGSAKYARRLAEKFPEHRRYVEPFAGSAAVLFAKARAEEEVLGDLDSEIVFALKYIQRLTPQAFAALKRLPWTVSRAGFERVKRCEPRSDAERFWKLVYGRLCAWGGRANMSGYSTIHDGQTYDLEDLWKFHERLKGVRILRQDWKKTLADHDGKETLFFLDPPYVEEWALGGEVTPEDIAEHVSRLRGRYVIAYTDSARARRALSKLGRIFRFKLLEARNKGLWAKRNRLFVASFDIKKSDDLEWLAVPEARKRSPTDAEFVLQYHYFTKRGEKPIREGPSQWHFDLRIDAGGPALLQWRLDHNIAQAPETVGYANTEPGGRELLEAEGFYPPGTPLNPTKDTAAFVEVLDRGPCALLNDEPGLKKVEFKGRALAGVVLLEKKNDHWLVKRAEAAPQVGRKEAACEQLAFAAV